MVVNVTRSILSINISLQILACFTFACNTEIHDTNFLKEVSNINKTLPNEVPLAQISNLDTYTAAECSFDLRNDSDVRIIGIGEILYNFASTDRRYYFLSDDIELFFNNSPKDDIPTNLIFSWLDGTGKRGRYTFKRPDGAEMKGFLTNDSIIKKYTAEIKIPWKILPLKEPNIGSCIAIDIAIGDTDDHFLQEGKIAWTSKNDPLVQAGPYGCILLASSLNDRLLLSPDTLISLRGSPTLNWEVDKTWNNSPSIDINDVVVGKVKDKYDLSARVRSCWDKTAIYFLIEIKDANPNRIWKERLAKEETFLDYGWIENAKGDKIWQMHVLNSKHAGGAYKNQEVDTIVHLKKGKYNLKYISDESHSYKNWDDDPPSAGVYGIAVYNASKR